jgi:hypothetical protein
LLRKISVGVIIVGKFSKLVSNPVEAILETKKYTNTVEAIGTLVIAAIIAAISIGIMIVRLGLVPFQMAALAAVAGFVVMVVACLFLGYVIKIITVTLGGKGNYAEGLTAISYAVFAPAVGALVSSIVSTIPYVGPIISFVVLVLACALGISTFYRAVKELFSVDMVTSLVAVSIFVMVLMTAGWIVFMNLIGSGFMPLSVLMPQIGVA